MIDTLCARPVNSGVRRLMVRNIEMMKINRILSLLGLLFLLSAPGFTQPKDVLGWQDARWGMSEKDIISVFGLKAKKLPERQLFLGRYVDYAIPEFVIAGKMFTVFFQMDNDSNKLSQVLVRFNEMKSRTSREDIFNRLVSSLAREYGAPSVKSDERQSFLVKFNRIRLNRTWKFPTTTVELNYGWDSQIYASLLTIRYFPTQ